MYCSAWQEYAGQGIRDGFYNQGKISIIFESITTMYDL